MKKLLSRKRIWIPLALVLLTGAAIGTGTLLAKKGGSLWHQRPASDPVPKIKAYDFSPLVAKIKPAVFNLFITGKIPKAARRYHRYRSRGQNPKGKKRRRYFEGPEGENPFNFFRRWRRYARPRWIPRRSRGSGFLINAKGYALTNYHVVRNAGKIRATLDDGREFQVKVIGKAPRLDLALIRLQGKKVRFPYAYLGDSNKAKVGEPVIAIGNARGLGMTVTAGIISAKGRVLRRSSYDDYIQTDASINRGNSGGPLFNRRGEVIGINTAILRGGRGIGFAIPINIARRILPQLKSKGRVDRVQLGVMIQAVTPALARSFGLKRPRGALVASVSPGSAADQAGIKVGDIILTFNGARVRNHHHLPKLVAFNTAGTKATVTLLRNGKRKKVKVTLLPWGKRVVTKDGEKSKPSATKKPSTKGSLRRIGVAIRSLSSAERQKLNLPTKEGVRVTYVRRGSPAANNGIRTGDVILEVNRTSVQSPAHFSKLLSQISKGENILLLIRRRDTALFLAFPLP